MDKIVPCLWFDGAAEEAARFYTSLVPDSRIDSIVRSPADNPSTRKGDVLVVEFTLGGRRFSGLNGGPDFPFTEAVSLAIRCRDQAEVDRIWSAILENGGSEVACGWIKDRWGLSWQIVPEAMYEFLASEDRDAAERAMQCMMNMVKLDVAELQRAYDGETAEA